MKAKHVFTTLGLALVMGLGVGAGLLHQGSLQQAKATGATLTEGTKIYIDCGGENQSWASASANFYAWTWYATASWEVPTYVEESDCYEFTLAHDATGMTLLREPGTAAARSGTTWGTDSGVWNKKDVEFVEGKDKLDATNIDVTNSWSVYVPVVHTYGVIGSFNSWASDEVMTLDAGVATIDIELAQGDEFKIRKDAKWGTEYGYNNLTAEAQAYFDQGENNDHSLNQNIVAKASGEYSLSLTLATGKIDVTNFTPETFKYYVKVAAGEYAEMTYVRDFLYENDTKTGHEYTATISATEGQQLFFKRNSTDIKPGASDGDHTNNLRYDGGTQRIYVVQDATNKTLTLRTYEDGGYDTYLAGYVASPKTWYFTNNKGWEGTPKFYTFDDLDQPKETWPGEDMTYVDIDGNGQPRYSFTFDSVKFTKLILLNADASEQTVDLICSSYSTSNGFYLGDKVVGGLDDGKYEVGSYTYAAVVRTVNVGGEPYALTESASQPGGDCLLQLETPAIDMNGGDQITYRIDGVATDFTLEAYYTNNAYYENQDVDYPKVLQCAHDQVFVKLMKDSSVVIYVGGANVVSQGYHILRNPNSMSTEITVMTHTDDYDGFTQYCSESIDFDQNETFKFVDMNNENALPVVFEISKIATGGLGDKFAYDSTNHVIKCLEDVTCAIYLKLKSGLDEIYFGSVAQYIADATAFAEGFNTAIGAVCKNDGSTVRSDLETAWAAQSTAFKALTPEAQAEVKKGSLSSVQAIKDCAAKYESVYRLRNLGSGWTLENFLEMDISPSKHVGLAMNANNTILLVVVISSVAIIASLGLTFYFLRKRKYSK